MSATAPDGSPVGLYATLAALGEPELIHGAVPAGSRILELGCGAGRAFVSAMMEYRTNGECWTHGFRSKLISDDEVDAALERAGLERSRWLDERCAWLEARLSRGRAG